jgi:hypothetical protein
MDTGQIILGAAGALTLIGFAWLFAIALPARRTRP